MTCRTSADVCASSNRLNRATSGLNAMIVVKKGTSNSSFKSYLGLRIDYLKYR